MLSSSLLVLFCYIYIYIYIPIPYVVICDSKKMRMKTKRAGKNAANIIQMGKVAFIPIGEINQPRSLGLDTSRPLGTFSFLKRTKKTNICISLDLLAFSLLEFEKHCLSLGREHKTLLTHRKGIKVTVF